MATDQRSGSLFPVRVVSSLPSTSNTVLVPNHPFIQLTMESRSLSRINAAKVLMAAYYSREDEKCKIIFVQNTFDLIHISQLKDLRNSRTY
jgi:hypothetical protein